MMWVLGVGLVYLAAVVVAQGYMLNELHECVKAQHRILERLVGRATADAKGRDDA